MPGYICMNMGDFLSSDTTVSPILYLGGPISWHLEHVHIYSTLEEAKVKAKKILSSDRGGIVEFTLSVEELRREFVNLDDKNKEKIKWLEEKIRVVHFGEFEITRDQLDRSLCEKNHNDLLTTKYDLNDTRLLQLSYPAFHYLDSLHDSLKFLLFIDFRLFHVGLEGWWPYHQREPGCVEDLFTAAGEHILTDIHSNKKPLITLKDIKVLHASLSKSVFAEEESRRGVFRDTYNSFPLLRDAVTMKGIKEFLLRIKEDNNPQGFMLGEYKRMNILSKFYGKMITCNPSDYLQDDTRLAKTIKEAEEENIQKISKEIAAQYHMEEAVAKEAVINIINDSNYGASLKNAMKDKENLSNFFSRICLDEKFKYEKNPPTQLEREFEMTCVRHTALVRADNIDCRSDKEFDQLAHNIYGKIAAGEAIHLLTPESQLAQTWAQKAVDEYNETIVNAKTIDEKISIICKLAHELEMLHLFHDVNCRTCYFLLNQLLLANGIAWSMWYNPNRLDLYDKEALENEARLGIVRLRYVCEHEKEFIEKNNKIALSEIDLKKQKTPNKQFQAFELRKNEKTPIINDDYEKISAFFIEKIRLYHKTFAQLVDDLINKYDLSSSKNLGNLFFKKSNKNKYPTEYQKIHDALIQLKKTNNIADYFREVLLLNAIPAFQSDIKKVEKISGFKQKWCIEQDVELSFQQKK